MSKTTYLPWHSLPDHKQQLWEQLQTQEAALEALRRERWQRLNPTLLRLLTPDRWHAYFFPQDQGLIAGYAQQERAIQLQLMTLRQQLAHDLIDDLPQLRPDVWRTLGLKERLRVALAVHQRYAQAFRMFLTPIKIEHAPHYQLDGSYRHNAGQDPILRINDDELMHPDPAEMVNTLVHETRHALHHQAVDQPSDFDYIPADWIEAWRENLEAYIPFWQDARAYRQQPIERDAWAAGQAAQDHLY
jgi:hypothetical protein